MERGIVRMGYGHLKYIWQRIYADFFTPSKLPAYEEFLRRFIDRGYIICSIADMWERIKNQKLDEKKKYLILRHDVDTDLSTAKQMWQIEKVLQVKSSYYFRLGTVDLPLMREIELSGGEASYHYEEIATVAKQKRLKTREQVFREVTYIRELFKRNLNSLRERSGIPMRIVASHGDFVNRRLKVYNWELLKDDDFRSDVGVELEVYDDAFMTHVTSRHSEVLTPHDWSPEHPWNAVKAGSPLIYVLVHPGNWLANPKENLVHDIKRAWEGLRYTVC